MKQRLKVYTRGDFFFAYTRSDLVEWIQSNETDWQPYKGIPPELADLISRWHRCQDLMDEKNQLECWLCHFHDEPDETVFEWVQAPAPVLPFVSGEAVACERCCDL